MVGCDWCVSILAVSSEREELVCPIWSVSDNPLQSQLSVGCRFLLMYCLQQNLHSWLLLTAESQVKTIEAFLVIFRLRIAEFLAWTTETHVRHFIASMGTGMVQWWEYSPPTNVAQVRFPNSASYVGWVCCWFSSLFGFFSRYLVSASHQKPTLLNSNSIWKVSQLGFCARPNFFSRAIMQLTNRRQISMVYTSIDHKMTPLNVQTTTTSRRRVVSLPSFEHFTAPFYGLFNNYSTSARWIWDDR